MPDPEGAAVIRRLSAEAAATAKQAWKREAAARTGGLPVHADMGGTLVVTAEGGVLFIDSDKGAVREETDAATIQFARVMASRLDPALDSWAPVRPVGARKCAACGGTGTVEIHGCSFICGKCFATGWLA